jgi:hypothetical protein
MKAAKQYFVSRSAGLKKAELLFLTRTLVEDYDRVKKGKLDKFSEKELETELLNRVLLNRIDELSYNSEDFIAEVKLLPFKVEVPAMPKVEESEIELTEDMEPALKEALEESDKKKAQEKRKKKAALP